MSNRKYLYLVVTKYPFTGGEPFLEEELRYLSKSFEKIHIVVPEGHRITDKERKFELPDNADLYVFKTVPSISDKLYGLASILSEKFKKETLQIRKVYQQQFSLFHLKTWIGFLSLAKCFQRQVKLIFKEHGYPAAEVTIYSYWFFYATAGIAMLKEEKPELNCITRIHGWDCFYNRAQGNYLPARPWVSSFIDGIYSISKAGLTHTMGKLPDARNIYLSYLGIRDIETKLTKDEGSSQLKLVSLAFIDPIKQLNRIVDALSLVEGQSIKWTHIGGSLNGDNSLVNYAKEKIGNKNNIEFDFKGSVCQSEVYKFFREECPDALICTSRSEGLPVSMMEALAHGVPVISVDVGGISEIVETNVNGLLISSDSNADEIAKAFVTFFNFSSEKKQHLRQNSLNVYEKRFKASINYPKFINEALI